MAEAGPGRYHVPHLTVARQRWCWRSIDDTGFSISISGPTNEMDGSIGIVSACRLPLRADICELQARNDGSGKADGIPAVQGCGRRGNGDRIHRRSVYAGPGDPALPGDRKSVV